MSPPIPPAIRPKRIAYMMSRFPKITETFVLYEILELEKLGFEMAIYPLLRHRSAQTHAEAESLVRRAVHYQPFLSPSIIGANLWFLFHRPIRYLRALWEIVSGTFGCSNFFLGALLFFPKCAWFARDMERRRIEHIHAHFANHPALAALFIHRLTHIPFSFTAHGSDLHVRQRMLDRKIAASRFTVMISQYNKRFVLDRFGERLADKMVIIHCGIDPSIFKPTPLPNGDTLNILTVASLRKVKGHRHLLDACHLLQQRGVSFHCHLVGDGPRRAGIEQQLQRLDLTTRVTLHGDQPRSRVAAWMAEADVVVLTSIQTRQGNREGIPVVLMEAMASARPVVASDLSGIPELVQHEKTGLLVPPGEPTAIADALQRLATDPDLNHTLGTAGRQRVVQHFNLKENVRELAGWIGGAGG